MGSFINYDNSEQSLEIHDRVSVIDLFIDFMLIQQIITQIPRVELLLLKISPF